VQPRRGAVKPRPGHKAVMAGKLDPVFSAGIERRILGQVIYRR
jgi:hypothetical protein